jgi:hypothetical protein
VAIWQLTRDGALTLESAPGAAADWIPLHRLEGPRGAAHLRVGAPLSVPLPSVAPTLRLLDVAAWIDGGRLLLRNDAGTLTGLVDLAAGRGELGIAEGAHGEALCTIASALLLGRLGRVLVHGAAVTAPDGRAWLLVGDSHAGKSTTLATLVRGGWGWLADDQVIIRSAEGQVVVEGWPRPVNLDAGYSTGRVTGDRAAIVPGPPFGEPVLGEVPLVGALLLRVDAGRPTVVAPVTGAEAFAELVRQSPWVVADRAAGPAVIGILERVASFPAAAVGLGQDVYGHSDALRERLSPFVGH